MIKVLTFARYRDLLGFHSLEMPTPPTLHTLLADPRFSKLPQDALLAVNQVFADRTAVLKDGDEVALLPPVSGG